MFGYKNIVEDLVLERMMESNDEHIPVIIKADQCDCEDLEACVERLGGVVKHRLHIIDAVAAYIPPISVRSMVGERAVGKIHLDDMVQKLMDIASVTVGSDFANESGLTGKNITVAVVDTGVYSHSDLIHPTNRIIGFKDFVNDKTAPYDDDGHGTHVAGTVAGNGFASSGKYMGVAPDANIVGVKVLNQDGGGSISDVIAGIQWVIQNRSRYNIKVMTLSLGTRAKKSYRDDPLCQAVDKAEASGITVVAAAGNSGPGDSTINSPAISPQIIAVGACDDRQASSPSNCKVADFSSRGPTPDGLNKPDILAPGVSITSLANKDSDYKSLSGTSMATPIVAGCAALLYENNPNITPNQVKSLMMNHCVNLGYGPDIQGKGLIDLKKILNVTNPKPREPQRKPHEVTDRPQGVRSIFGNWFIVIMLVALVLIL